MSTSTFSNNELQLFKSIEGKIVDKVFIYFWVNNFNVNDKLELIVNFEMLFTDQSHIHINLNEECTEISITKTFELEAQNKELELEFQSKIKIVPINASQTKMWQDVIGKKVEQVLLSSNETGYLNDACIIHFSENEHRTIGLSPLDGLILDYYEE